MPTSRGVFCPEWCVEVHPQKVIEDNLTIHWKGFGSLPGGNESLVKVWVAFDGDKQYSSGAEVEALETYWADDIRALSRDCLQAAAWMEENLSSITSSSTHP